MCKHLLITELALHVGDDMLSVMSFALTVIAA